MNREHNSLVTAMDEVREILKEVPNCNDRGNYMETLLGLTVQLASDSIYYPLFRFAVHLNVVAGLLPNDVAVCVRAICCKIWRILYICFNRERTGIDPYVFRYGEQTATNAVDRDFALRYPTHEVPSGGFTEITSLNNLSMWTKMDAHTYDPESLNSEWADHSITIWDVLGMVNNRYNPSYDKLKSMGADGGKAYSTPTDDDVSEHESPYAVATVYYDIPNNDIPQLRLHSDCQGTELFYMMAQVTEQSRKWQNSWEVESTLNGEFAPACVLCGFWVSHVGQNTHHYEKPHQALLERYKASGGNDILPLICQNLPRFLTHGQAVPVALQEFILKLGASPQCRTEGQRDRDATLTGFPQCDLCLRDDHRGTYRRELDVTGAFNGWHCTACKKWGKHYGKPINQWDEVHHTNTVRHKNGTSWAIDRALSDKFSTDDTDNLFSYDMFRDTHESWRHRTIMCSAVPRGKRMLYLDNHVRTLHLQ